MELTVQDFFHGFCQELLAGAEVNESFQLAEFMDTVAAELIETGVTEGFEFCHYRAQRGMRVDGYWFNDDGVLDLFVADFDSRKELLSLTKTDVESAFKRLANFVIASKEKKLYLDLEETAPEYGLSRQIADRGGMIRRLNFFLVSERALSDRLQAFEDRDVSGIPSSFHIWDMSRLQRQQSSRGHKEALDISFPELFDTGISCLPAHLGLNSLKSYLVVMPGTILSALYEKYGARLLEQNVRCFLQARGKVNKGIRATILNEPDMFFAYNNGITATAREVETRATDAGLEIIRIADLQIVNGGQTTASLFHTKRKDKASIENIFLQMKLSVVDSDQSEEFVPKISEYANTQNRVNAADFFSNHPFHIRMEEFSRRIWAPAQQGAQRETKWFYERARGQYADAQASMTPGEARRYKAEHPKPQMFSKTDLAKFENAWDENPRWVNLGAQKNFAPYAARIGREWTKSPDKFSEFYFQRAIARAICFRTTEKLVSKQPWYNGGYRANIVAYSLAMISEICRQKTLSVNFSEIWTNQSISPAFQNALEITSRFVNDALVDPPQGISNVTEWAKKEGCWLRLKDGVAELIAALPSDFINELISVDAVKADAKDAKNIQKMDDGINAQKRVFEIPAQKWSELKALGEQKKLFTPKELGILNIAAQIPAKIPSEKQCAILIDVLKTAEQEGLLVSND